MSEKVVGACRLCDGLVVRSDSVYRCCNCGKKSSRKPEWLKPDWLHQKKGG